MVGDVDMSRLKANISAPGFVVNDIFGNEQSPEKYLGKKWMLSFFRYASCPACNMRIQNLLQEYDELKQNGLSILAVFESPKDSIMKYVGKSELPFSVIPDHERKLYKLYGVESSWLGYIMGGSTVIKALWNGFMPGKMEGVFSMIPADFLINPDGTIYTAYYGKNIGDHLPIRRIWSYLKANK
ncbi:MAG TPA: redoxin domain-containing protein [Candidatus Marinimicrobia bacterium]|nr:redoxin domain-containing protein [Candidatus Neomarinimicrobiota bacterium]